VLARCGWKIRAPLRRGPAHLDRTIRRRAELDAAARSLFRASAARILRNLGDSSGAQTPGDLTGGGSHVTVFIVLNVQGM